MLQERFVRRTALAIGTALLLAAFFSIGAQVERAYAQDLDTQYESYGIVKNIANAPVIGNGTVAGAETEFVINLDVSTDPNVPGKGLLEGDTIRVTLPDEFVNSGMPALENIMSNDDCTPANMLCTAAVMVQGWPQRPVPPPWYDMSLDGNTLVVTAKQDIMPNPPEFAGIKVIHLMFKSFTNPDPGFYPIYVVAETGKGGAIETGSGIVEILSSPVPHMGVTSVFNEGAPNTIYQSVAPGEVVPLAYDFLLWDQNNEPMVDVNIKQIGANLWSLVQDDKIVGVVNVQGPKGATGVQLYNEEPSTRANAPLTKAPAGRLTAFFQAGSLPGDYVANFHLFGGNSQQMFVTGTRAMAETADDAEEATAASSDNIQNSGIVKNIVNAPVIGDGTVAGAKTEFVINLDVSTDPNVAGKGLLEGDTIRVALPDEFVNSGVPALENIMSNDDCTPANMLCSAAVMVQGWPQRPVPPPWYDMSLDGNTLVVTAKRDIIPNPPAFAGIKVIHLMFKSFTNPEPGFYEIGVEAETGVDGEVEMGTGIVEILPSAIPHLGVTSVFNEGAPNTIYQNASIGELAPLAYDFLLWDQNNEPMLDVNIEQVGENLWSLVKDDLRVGVVNVLTPDGATGVRLFNEEPSAEVNAPLTKAPAGRLRTFFQTGSVPGDYVANFHLFDGNSQQMFVKGTSSLSQSFVRLPDDTQDPSGNTMIANCGGEPYADAAATIAIDQLYRNSTVHISLKDARPNTFYTLWLRLRGQAQSDEGEVYGGSPITDAGSTPLAPSSALSSLIASGAEDAGNTEVANGFMTDSDGNGATSIELDFPMLGGAYPFQKSYPNLAPVPIMGAPFAPFMVRLVSHCTDNVGHGVNAGNREPWFDWSPK